MHNHDPRTTEYNQQGDVWQHSHAFHNVELRTPQRSPDVFDLQDRLWYRAQAVEAGDRVTAQLLREACARIGALETLLLTTSKPLEGGA